MKIIDLASTLVTTFFIFSSFSVASSTPPIESRDNYVSRAISSLSAVVSAITCPLTINLEKEVEMFEAFYDYQTVQWSGRLYEYSLDPLLKSTKLALLYICAFQFANSFEGKDIAITQITVTVRGILPRHQSLVSIESTGTIDQGTGKRNYGIVIRPFRGSGVSPSFLHAVRWNDEVILAINALLD